MSLLIGANMAGGEFGGGNIPGRYEYDYKYPTVEQIDWYALKAKLGIIRIPFFSQRLIRNGSIYQPEISLLMTAIDRAGTRGMKVILDRHEYAKKPDGSPITTSAADMAASRRIWRQISAQFRSRGNVIFGINNEPNVQTPVDWFTIAKNDIAGIREVASTAPIALMGSYWGTADDFVRLNGDAFDAANFDEFVLVEVHQYFDGHGGKPDGNPWRAIPGKAATSFQAVTDWARARGRKLILGEYGFTADAGDMEEGRVATQHLVDNDDVWHSAILWAGSRFWQGRTDRAFSVEPDTYTATTLKPQLQLLRDTVAGA